MFSIRNAWWAPLTAAALVIGCGAEESVTPDSPVPASTPTPATAPAAPKDGMKAELTPDASATPASSATKDDAGKKDESAPSKLDAPKIDPPKVDAPKLDAPKGDAGKAAASAKLTDDEIAAIKKLPADEQVAALKQKVCPVSDEHLGSMDTPIKVSAEGKTFYLCCKGCKKDLDADPKAVLAKLSK